MQAWSIGFALPEWRSLLDHLRAMKFTDAEIERAGLSKRRDHSAASGSAEVSHRGGENYYDAFRERVMFPIFDTSGRVVGFSGRTLSKDPTTPKYINSPETPLFNKSELLYGLHKAKSPIRKLDYSVLVEGQMDLVMCHQAGYANTIAASGTALTAGHLERLKKLSSRIILAYDSDSAGEAAAEKNARLALRHGFEVKIAALPAGSDPADLILEDKAKWADVIRQSKHVIDFELDRLARLSDKRAIALGMERKVLPFVSDLRSNLEKSHYIAEAARRFGYREEAIWDDLKKLPKNPEIATPGAVRSVIPGNFERPAATSLERRVMGIMYWKPDDPGIGNFRDKVIGICGEEKYLAMKDETAEIAEELIFETEHYYESKDILDRDKRELLLSLERKELERKIDEARTSLRRSTGGESGGVTDGADILRSLHDLAKRLEDVKREQGTSEPVTGAAPTSGNPSPK